MTVIRTARAGSAIEDYCRACKADRMHTVIAADPAGQPMRVHAGSAAANTTIAAGRGPNCRAAADAARSLPKRLARPAPPRAAPEHHPATGFPIVSDRERSAPPIMLPGSATDLELLLRRVIREETGITAVAPAEKWRGGIAGAPAGHARTFRRRSIPIETFFHKIVMLRNRLRTLEQQVNASDLPDDAKVKLQAYISGCYGSLTTFNVLFADEDDQFKGSGGE